MKPFFKLLSFYKIKLKNTYRAKIFQSMGFSLICLIKEKAYYKTKSFPVLRMYQACTLAKDRWLTDEPESSPGWFR